MNELFSAAKIKGRPDRKAKFHAVKDGHVLCTAKGELHFHRTGVLKKKDAIVALLEADPAKACAHCLKKL